MNKKILITADSSCDLNQKILEKYNIKTIPLHVNFDDESFLDGVDINPQQLYDIFYTTKKLPKTSAINIQEYIDFFKPFVDSGYEIIHFSLGSGFSTSYQNCKIASEELKGVYPVDTNNLSSGTGILAMEAADLLEKDYSVEEILYNINYKIKKVSVSFVLDRLEFMCAGGRCSSVAKFGANLLSLKPCIEVDNSQNGSMNVFKKYRGKLNNVLIEYIDERLQNPDTINSSRCIITHSGIDKNTEKEIYKYVKSKKIFKDVYITTASCTISSHSGPNTLGIIFVKK